MDPLARIFGSPARLKLLRLFLFNDDTSFEFSDIIFRARVTKEIGRKELSILTASGVVKKKTMASGVVYCANKRFLHYDPLLNFLRSSTDVSDSMIVTALRKAGVIRLIALSGVFTGVIESKVDILVVGDKLDERVLTTSIRTLEAELGRELRFASFSTEDFRYRVGVYDRLLRDVFDYPHRRLIDKIGL